MKVERHRTAIVRNQLSRPVVLALRDNVLHQRRTFFDFGCGRGQDLEYLSEMGIAASGWDPVHAPDRPKTVADVVNLGYVINVVEDPQERAEVVREALGLARCALVVAAMVGFRERSVDRAEQFGDGVVTRRGTFQKYFDQGELRDYVSSVSGREAYPAGLGVFYVFVDGKAEDEYCALVASESAPLDSSSAIGSIRLAPDSIAAIGEYVRAERRLPHPQQLPSHALAVGLLASSDDWVDRLSGILTTDEVRSLKRERRFDLLRKICQAFFSPTGGLRMSDLSFSDRADVRSVFGSMDRAVREAEATLRGLTRSWYVERLCREWGLGKLTPSALYLHRSLREFLPRDLELMVSCAEELTGADISDANIIKIDFKQVGVSFATYPDFETQAHPRLARATRADFATSTVASRTYEASRSAPILHRKELFVGPEHPKHASWSSFTREEEALGLLGRRDIGTEASWGRFLASRGVKLDGSGLSVGAPYEFKALYDEDDGSQSEDDFEVPLERSKRKSKSRPAKTKKTKPPFWTEEKISSLADALSRLGRPPLPHEVSVDPASIRRFARVEDWREFFGERYCPETFEAARLERWKHWLIFLAGARFSTAGRPRLGKLDASSQADIKCLFSSYRQACAEADHWLLKIGQPEEITAAIASWPRGFHSLQKGLYFHKSLEPKLPVVLRLMILCAESMAGRSMPGRVTVTRIANDGENVKFYQYEGFDSPGPAIRTCSVKVDFRKRRVIPRDYFNPPRLLLRRSAMLDLNDPRTESLQQWELALATDSSEVN